MAGAREEEFLRQVLASPHWGANSPLVSAFERLNVGLLVHGRHDSVLGGSERSPTTSALRLNSGSVETHSRGMYKLKEALLRPATEGDFETLGVLMREFYEYEQRAYTSEKVQALLDLLRNSSFGKVALLWDGDAPAGYVVVSYGYSIEFHGRDLLIDELYIREEYRGRGWGTWTLGEIEKMARAEGLHAVHLEVARRNARARRFYGRAGFDPHDGDFLSKRLGGSP